MAKISKIKNDVIADINKLKITDPILAKNVQEFLFKDNEID